MMHRNATAIVILLFTLLLLGACNDSTSSGGGAVKNDGFTLASLEGKWYYSTVMYDQTYVLNGWMRVDSRGTVTWANPNICDQNKPITPNWTFSVASSGKVTGRATFKCTKVTTTDMPVVIESLTFDLTPSEDGNRLHGTVTMQYTRGSKIREISFDRE